jgi:copper chaperone
MIAFEVPDMTCQHCASAITKALSSVDGDARVAIDLKRRVVTVEHSKRDEQALSDSIAHAGYTPVAISAASIAMPARSGTCCGSCR